MKTFNTFARCHPPCIHLHNCPSAVEVEVILNKAHQRTRFHSPFACTDYLRGRSGRGLGTPDKDNLPAASETEKWRVSNMAWIKTYRLLPILTIISIRTFRYCHLQFEGRYTAFQLSVPPSSCSDFEVFVI